MVLDNDARGWLMCCISGVGRLQRCLFSSPASRSDTRQLAL